MTKVVSTISAWTTSPLQDFLGHFAWVHCLGDSVLPADNQQFGKFSDQTFHKKIYMNLVRDLAT